MAEPIKELDILLNQVCFISLIPLLQSFFLNILLNFYYIQIAAGLPLDIMPGPSDPANFSLPQQVLMLCLKCIYAIYSMCCLTFLLTVALSAIA